MKILVFSGLVMLSTIVLAQQASDYFPSQTGYNWSYKVFPLDSANNQIDSLSYFRADSFAVTTNYLGRNADLVVSKTGPLNIINSLPYTDSSYFSFENTDGYQYFSVSNLGNLVSLLDSIGLDSTLLGVILSFEDWYPVYRFGQSVGNEYTIFTKDTTINLGGSDLPLRFQYLGKRLADDTVQTETGTYACKQFLLSTVVKYIIIPPNITFELFRLTTTKWISQNIWLVQEISPSTTIDLSFIGYPVFTVLGTKTVLTPSFVNVELTSFTGSLNNSGQVVLNWQTATETNNRVFEIERKTLNGAYTVIGYVNGAGTTTEPHSYSFIDRNVNTGVCTYRLKQIDFDGSYEYSNAVEISVNGKMRFNLAQNYPNPFNPSTNIEFKIPESGDVSLKVYNVLGKEVLTLINEQKNAGTYSMKFNPESDKLSSGIYFYVLKFKGLQLNHKMIFLK